MCFSYFVCFLQLQNLQKKRIAQNAGGRAQRFRIRYHYPDDEVPDLVEVSSDESDEDDKATACTLANAGGRAPRDFVDGDAEVGVIIILLAFIIIVNEEQGNTSLCNSNLNNIMFIHAVFIFCLFISCSS